MSALAFFLLIAAGSPVAFHFQEVNSIFGIVAKNTYGGLERKDLILETTGNGVAVFDFDNDGNEDILLLSAINFTNDKPVLSALYRNEGGGKFTEVGASVGLGSPGWAQAACVADVDNDGYPDIFVTFFGSNRLLRNTGKGKFEDVTARWGLPVTGRRYGSGCAFLDYDRDGRLDLFVANYVDLDPAKTPKPGSSEQCLWKEIPVMCGPRGLPLAKNILYHQEKNGTFRDVSREAGVLAPGGRYSLQAVAADFNDDGWPDLYVACDMTPSLLFENKAGPNGTRVFEERGAEAGVAYNFDGRLQAGMGVAVADFDGDGRLDIAKTNFSGDLPSLYHNDDGRFFTDVSREYGLGLHQYLGWGVAFSDFDEDGWPDLILANGHVYPEVDRHNVGDKYRQPTLLYRNEGGKKFRDVSATAGPALQALRPSRGLALGDLDGDGRPEVVILNMNEPPSVLKNDAPGGNWVNLRLAGVQSNRSAIGARWTVSGGGQRWVGEVSAGGSFYSTHSLVQHVGVGALKEVEVEVRWPNGQKQAFGKLAVNAAYTLTEGEGVVAGLSQR